MAIYDPHRNAPNESYGEYTNGKRFPFGNIKEDRP